MTAPLVIEHLDVIEQLHLRLATAVEAIGELVLRIKRNLRGMGMLSSAHFGVEHASEEIESRRDRVVAAAHDAAKACAYHSPTQVPPTALLFFPFGQIVSAQ